MVVISLKFPAKRFHATPWGRQVNEGAVEWPPSPWRLLRSLVAVWHHKFPEVPEAEVRALIERLATPPRFRLPPASQGHTRHYMPLANDDRTKIFDTFIALSPDEPVVAVWPDIDLTDAQRDLLHRLLAAMTYFGRAESWVHGELLDDGPVDADVVALELGQEPPEDYELVRTLVPVSAEEHAEWYGLTHGQHRQRRLQELRAAALAKGKPADNLKLAKKDEAAIDASLPATLFDALHADTSELRKAGWNQPPGSRWVNYTRPTNAFSPQRTARSAPRRSNRPTVARFAVCGPVRPSLTEALFIGEKIRERLMGCSRAICGDASPMFSGKRSDGTPSHDGHRHAHYLCESATNDRSISHINVFSPDGFDDKDELAFAKLAHDGVRRKDGNNLQIVLLGVGHPEDFGGTSQAHEKAGRSRLLGSSKHWVSRTPFVLTRHLTRRSVPSLDAIAADPRLRDALIDAVRFELKSRPEFEAIADDVGIEPILNRDHAGTDLGGHFTAWHKFRRDRQNGGGAKSTSSGFGFHLIFREPVQGPIALGYGCHFGLGQFMAEG